MQCKWPNSVRIKVKDNNFDFIANFTCFGKIRVSSNEYYYSWNKNSIIFSKIAVGKGTDITLLHYTCIL